jgi:F0F1-type ATP synthase assembly protein I
MDWIEKEILTSLIPSILLGLIFGWQIYELFHNGPFAFICGGIVSLIVFGLLTIALMLTIIMEKLEQQSHH